MASLVQNQLKYLLSEQTDLELAILIGSQAMGKADNDSDWDIAIRWLKTIEPLERLAQTETLRRLLAKQLQQPETKIDLIDISTASLAMRAVIAEEGIILKGEDTMAWHYFLQRTWRELETYYWNKIYAT